jgi:dipeptidyl aminopeptidase/acylaminoacyl peptidase
MPRSTPSRPARRLAALVALVALALPAAACEKRAQRPRSFYFPPGSTAASAPPPAGVPPAPSQSAAAGYKGLGVESIPPEVLARYAPQPLSPDASRRVQAMLDVRAPGAGIVSNDGKRLFFSWTITGTQQIFRLDAPMGFPVQLTGGEDSTSVVAVTPDDKWLVVSRDRSGEENPGLYLLSVEGGPMKVVQHKPKVQTFFDYVAPDGKTLYYRANDVAPESYVIYSYEIASGKREAVFDQAGIWSVADARTKKGGGAEKLLLQKAVGANMNEYFELDLASKKLEPLFGQGEREDYWARYGAGDEVLVRTPKLGEYRRLYAWTKAAGLKPISHEVKFDVSGFSVDRGKQRILYTTNEGGYTKLHGLDAKTKRALKLPALPAGDHAFFGMTSEAGRFTTFQVDPGTAPAQSFVYDWEGGTLKKWHAPSTPEIDTKAFARATLESYTARDGTAIPMFVRRPAGCDKRTPAEGPCPVVVSFHGGPEGQTVAGFNTRAQLFVDAGFVFAEPNVRGSDGYGKAWLHADDGPKRLAIITDIEDAARHVRQKFAVGGRAPKVGIYGGSYGGYSALVGMTMFAGAYDAGVSVVGISSLLTFLENTAPYRRVLRISEYGDPQKDREALLALSPTSHIDKLRAPLMILQGATDPRVPAGESLQFHEALQKKGVPSELMIFADEGHGFRKRSNQVLALGHTVRFFEKHLK